MVDRIGPKRGLAALVSQAPLEPRPVRLVGGAGKSHGYFKALAGAKGSARRLRDDEPWPLQLGQPFGEGARVVPNIHEAVQFPLSVIELGNDIAGDLPLPAQRLDLALKPAILKLLRRADEPVEVAEDRREPSIAKARFDPVRISGAEVPLVPAFKPPGFASVRLQDVARMRQSPDAELRADQRLVAAAFGVSMR